MRSKLSKRRKGDITRSRKARERKTVLKIEQKAMLQSEINQVVRMIRQRQEYLGVHLSPGVRRALQLEALNRIILALPKARFP